MRGTLFSPGRVDDAKISRWEELDRFESVSREGIGTEVGELTRDGEARGEGDWWAEEEER